MGGGGGLVWFNRKHRQTNKNKKGALKSLPQPHFPGPKPSHFHKCVSYKMVGVEICPACTYPLPWETLQSFFPVSEIISAFLETKCKK